MADDHPILRIKNWQKFQHYRDRKPPWIKLHRSLLDHVEYHELSSQAAKYLPLIWIVASEKDGEVPENGELAWRLHVSAEDAQLIVQELLNKGFIFSGSAEQPATQTSEHAAQAWASRHIPYAIKLQVAVRDKNSCVWCGAKENIEYDHITPVSKGGESVLYNIQLLCRSCNRKKRTRDCDRAAQLRSKVLVQRSTETETETERETERDIVAKTATATDRFDEFWACYPKRVGKAPARKAWTRIAGANGLAGEIIEGIARWRQNRQWDDPRFIPNPATFLNQRRWEDEVPADSKMLTDREREYKREASVGAGPEVPQGTRLETSEFTLEELDAEIARSKARRKKQRDAI